VAFVKELMEMRRNIVLCKTRRLIQFNYSLFRMGLLQGRLVRL